MDNLQGDKGREDPRTDQLVRGLDAAAVLLNGVSSDVKAALNDLSRLSSDLKILTFRVESNTRTLESGDGLLVRLHNLNASMRENKNDIERLEDWIENEGKKRAEQDKIRVEMEASAQKIQAENQKRRWGFWTAFATAMASILMQIIPWLIKLFPAAGAK